MGWTSFHLNQPVKEWFKENWNSDKAEVLEVAVVERNTLYAAIKNLETQEVFCAVYLLRWSKDHYNFTYKDMSEFVGPLECQCPEKVFKLLTPLKENEENKFAIEWHKRVKKYLDGSKLIKTGDYVIKTKEPVSFSNGSEYQYFKKMGRRMYAGKLIDNRFTNTIRVRFNPNHYQTEMIAL